MPLVASADPISILDFAAGATLIDFEDLPAGNCNGCGTQVTNQYSLFGVLFDDPTFPGGATVQNNLTFGVPDASGSNILFVRQGGLIGDPAATPLKLTFTSGVDRVGFNYASSADSFLLLQAFNGNQLVESLTFTGSPTPIGWGGFAGIGTQIAFTSLEISYHPLADPSRTLNFSMDNLRFESVPEPSSLMLGALGLAGIAWKRRASLRG